MCHPFATNFTWIIHLRPESSRPFLIRQDVIHPNLNFKGSKLAALWTSDSHIVVVLCILTWACHVLLSHVLQSSRKHFGSFFTTSSLVEGNMLTSPWVNQHQTHVGTMVKKSQNIQLNYFQNIREENLHRLD